MPADFPPFDPQAALEDTFGSSICDDCPLYHTWNEYRPYGMSGASEQMAECRAESPAYCRGAQKAAADYISDHAGPGALHDILCRHDDRVEHYLVTRNDLTPEEAKQVGDCFRFYLETR